MLNKAMNDPRLRNMIPTSLGGIGNGIENMVKDLTKAAYAMVDGLELPIGPKTKRYNPLQDGPIRKFKEGQKKMKNESLCMNRYQQVSITALGDLATNKTLRNLQNANASAEYKMTFTVGTTGF